MTKILFLVLSFYRRCSKLDDIHQSSTRCANTNTMCNTCRNVVICILSLYDSNFAKS